MFPDYWSQFINDNNLIGKEIIIPEKYVENIEIDESEEIDEEDRQDAELKIFDEKSAKYEATEIHPGIDVFNEGFIPVAGSFTGDPYFINLNEGESGALYVVYHDTAEKEVVLSHFKDLLKFNQA